MRKLQRQLRYLVGLTWSAGPRQVLVLVALAIGAGVAPALGALALARTLDRLAAHDASGATRMAILLATSGFVAAVMATLVHVVQRELNRRLVREAKGRLFERIGGLERLAPFEDPGFHDKMRLAEQSGTVVPQAITSSLSGLVQGLMTCVGLMFVLIRAAPLALLALALVAVPAAGAALAASRERAHVMGRISGRFRREMFYAGLLTEPPANQETRLLGLSGLLRDRMRSEMRTIDEAEADLDKKYLLRQEAFAWLGAAVLALIIITAVREAAGGATTLGTVALVITASGAFAAAVGGVIDRIADARQGLLMFEHFQDLVDGDDHRDSARPALPPLRAGIEVRNLSFRYPSGASPVLDGLSLYLPCGRTTALVGLNGAGESTLVKLLCGLYEPTSGSILWDGQDVSDVQLTTLRRRIGAVFQDFMQYELSAADNIGLGDVQAIDDAEAIDEAARAAGATAIVQALPSKHETMLSRTFFGDDDEPSVMLSGGQWQRLALARAYMRINADLMILDEPSSGLDADAEAEVHLRLRQARRGRTNLLISHRLSAVRHADHIYVLAGGKVHESGSHDTLMAAGGEYARLFLAQASGYQETASDDHENPLELDKITVVT